jgi:Tfp pilus assembly protein PilV
MTPSPTRRPRSAPRALGKGRQPAVRAFSLVEVTMALGLMAFCLVALIGLLATGFIGMRSSHEQNSATFLLEKIAADVQAGLDAGGANSPIYRVPLAGGTGQLQSMATPLEYAGSQFTVSHRLERTGTPPGGCRIFLRAAWPPGAPEGRADYAELVSAWSAP